MVHVSHETTQQTHDRLARVLASATLTVYDEPYAFEERRVDEAPAPSGGALAVVVDDDVASYLVPAREDAGERFGIVKVHFPDGVDNSGFVGWLATHMKAALGTGVFVVCGSNRERGGIYDYWGFPWELRERVADVIARLRGR